MNFLLLMVITMGLGLLSQVKGIDKEGGEGNSLQEKVAYPIEIYQLVSRGDNNVAAYYGIIIKHSHVELCESYYPYPGYSTGYDEPLISINEKAEGGCFSTKANRLALWQGTTLKVFDLFISKNLVRCTIADSFTVSEKIKSASFSDNEESVTVQGESKECTFTCKNKKESKSSYDVQQTSPHSSSSMSSSSCVSSSSSSRLNETGQSSNVTALSSPLINQFLASKNEGTIDGFAHNRLSSGIVTWKGGVATIWDVRDGSELGEVQVGASIGSVLFTADNSKVVIQGEKDVIIWDFTTDKVTFLVKSTESLKKARLSSDAQRILIYGEKTITLYDMQTRKVIASLDGLIISKNGMQGIMVKDTLVTVWDMDVLMPRKTITLKEAAAPVMLSDNGGFIVACRSSELKVVNTLTGLVVKEIEIDDKLTGLECNHDDTKLSLIFADGNRVTLYVKPSAVTKTKEEEQKK
jgi:hypothetical protein